MVPPKQIDKVYFNTICCLGLSLSLFLQHHVVSTEEFESQGPGDVFFFHRLDCECSQVGT